jgi:peptidoglycan/LPS O-acetylase OafA/YrhL
MTVAARQNFPGLDAIRFAAAALVMSYHLGVATWAAPESVTYSIVGGRARFPELLDYAWFGFVGVEIFFVLSGFVISCSAARASARAFAWARFLRLYPAAWICATTTAVILILAGAENTPSVVSGWKHSIVLYPIGPWVDSVYWTLGIEMVFYASVFSLLSVGSPRWIEPFARGLGAVSALYWIGGDLIDPRFLRDHLWDRSLELSLVPYGVFFALGVGLQSVMTKGPSLWRLVTILAMLSASFVEIAYKAEFNRIRLGSTLPALLPGCVFMLSVTAMILSTRRPVAGAGAVFLRAIGLTTYPLYLLHDHVGAAAIRIGGDLRLNRYMALSIAILICLLASGWIAIVAEPALRRAIQGVGDRLLALSMAIGAKARASIKASSVQG